MFNKQFLEDFFNGNYCPSDGVGSNSFEMRYLSHKIDNLEKQIRKNLNKHSKHLVSKLNDCRQDELNYLTQKAYYQGINFTLTLFIIALNSEDL